MYVSFYNLFFLHVANITCYSICSFLATNLLYIVDCFYYRLIQKTFFKYSVFLPADCYLAATVLIVVLYLSLNKVVKRDKC